MVVRVIRPSSMEALSNEFSTITTHPTQKRPALDVLEREHDYKLVAELPGYRKENLKISFEEGVLTLSGEQKSEEQSDIVRVRLNEIGTHSFSRALRFGGDIEAEKISAHLENGILTVTVPKADSAKPRTIAITIQ